MDSTLSIGDEGRSMKLIDVSANSGGASKMARSAIGSAAVQAALTLLPCVHITGCGDASQDALHAMLSSIGPCRVHIIRDEETGECEGEASCTYDSAASAMLAIERFDGSRFDDDVLCVTVARMAAQGSLTKRGRGRNSDRETHHDRQQRMAGAALAERAQAERDAFATARVAAASSSRAALPIERDAFTPSLKPRAAAAEQALPRKRSAPPPKLPSFMVKRTATAAPAASDAAPSSVAGANAIPAGGDAVESAAAKATEEDTEEGGVSGGGLLGLAAYGDGSDSD